MLPPAFVEHEVGAAVAVDVADAFTVVVVVELGLCGDRHKFPWFGGFGPVRSIPTPLLDLVGRRFAGDGNQLGLAVAVDIPEERGFTENAVGDEVFFPARVGFGGLSRAGIFIPECLMMQHAAEDENVGAAVAVEVGDEGEHRVCRIFFELLLHGLVKRVAGLEVGAGIPERAGDDIHLTVAVDIGGVHAVAPVFGSEGEFFEGDRARRGRGVGGAGGKRAEQKEGK